MNALCRTGVLMAFMVAAGAGLAQSTVPKSAQNAASAPRCTDLQMATTCAYDFCKGGKDKCPSIAPVEKHCGPVKCPSGSRDARMHNACKNGMDVANGRGKFKFGGLCR